MAIKSTLTLFVSLMMCMAVLAQEVMVSDEIHFKNEDGFEIIGRIQGSLILSKSKVRGANLYAFDTSMKLLWEKKIECVSENFKYIGCVYNSNFFGIFLQYKHKGEHIIEIQKMNTNGEIIEKNTIKNYGKRNFSPDINILNAANHSVCAIVNKKNSTQLEAFSFDLTTMKIIEDISTIPISSFSYPNDLQGIEVDNKGAIYIIWHKTFPKHQDEKNQFIIYVIKNNQYYSYSLFTPRIKIFDAIFDFDEKHETLVGGGFWDIKRKAKASGYFYIKMPKKNPSKYHFYHHLFNTKLLTTVRGKSSQSGQSFSGAYIKDIILKSNGGAVLVSERFNENTQGSSIGHRTDDIHQISVLYSYNDIIVIDIRPDGTSGWNEVLYKRQYSRNDGGSSCSFFIQKTAKMLHFVYHNGKKTKNEISEYRLSRTGKSNRHLFTDTLENNANLLFRYGKQTAPNEFIVPSISRQKMKLSSVRY